MSIHVSEYPIHVREDVKFDREYMRSQEKPRTERKEFQRDTLEISLSSKEREAMRYRFSHTVNQSVTLFGNTRAEILKELREEKGQYGYSDVVNACGLAYAKLYAEIEKRHENGQEQYFDISGNPLTKEEEIEWLNTEYEGEVAWQKACARIAAQREFYLGHIPEMPTKAIEELEDNLYLAKEAYLKLYQENKKEEKPLVLQNFVFGNSVMHENAEWIK